MTMEHFGVSCYLYLDQMGFICLHFYGIYEISYQLASRTVLGSVQIWEDLHIPRGTWESYDSYSSHEHQLRETLTIGGASETSLFTGRFPSEYIEVSGHLMPFTSGFQIYFCFGEPFCHFFCSEITVLFLSLLHKVCVISSLLIFSLTNI